MVKRKHVFICHSSKDAHFADRVRQILERTQIPVWWDLKQPTRGTPQWEQMITSAIDSSCCGGADCIAGVKGIALCAG